MVLGEVILSATLLLLFTLIWLIWLQRGERERERRGGNQGKMVLGEEIVSTTFPLRADKLTSPSTSELGRLHGLEDELERLKRTLERLGALFQDAEQRKLEKKYSVMWLRELKKVALDAEDVVDEFEYEDLRRKVEGSCEDGCGSGESEVNELLSPPTPHTSSFREEMSCRIEDIWRRLEEIFKDKKDLGISGMLDAGHDHPEFKRKIRETSSLLADPEVFGRDQVKEELLKLLLGKAGGGPSSSSMVPPTSFSVLSIAGMGGLGKTTLAQWVYNNREVQDHFNLRMWVYVSHDFDLKKLTKHMLEHAVDPQSGLQTIDNLNVLQEKLLEKLRGKRFLLILDDVWEEDCTKWHELFAPLVHGEKGSKVLITTRNASVAKAVRSVNIFELDALSPKDCWSIFKKHAFPDRNSDKHPNLELIGTEIVKKLNGVPLAATTIGSLLRTESEESEWENVLKSELWELEQGGEGILSALRVSIEYLPWHLKQCFVYCSMFPKGYQFVMLELVQLWMAQVYVQPMGRKPVEDVGKNYFNELFNKSLIQFVNGRYVIHDLLHDLGRHILHHDCYQIGPGQVQGIPEDADSKVHLTLDYEESLGEELEVLYRFSSLRTLAFWFSGSPYIQLPSNLFHIVKCLRVLDLSGYSLDTLPDSIGSLKHLRYLDLRKTKIKCLPNSLCCLYKLQTLKLHRCDELNMLPNAMSNLSSLHYLEAKHELVSKIVKIGKLIHLQNLEIFCVAEENGNKIVELKNMNELHGKLCIQNLERVETRKEATEAALKNKRYVRMLEMEWADDRKIDQVDNQLEESIIEELQPPSHLKDLTLKCYAGMHFPSWMNNRSISGLESIHLHKCMNLIPLPSVEHLSFLRTLEITSCSQMDELPCLPKSLQNLILQNVSFSALPNNLHDLALQQLVICQIPELRELPLLPITLKELTVDGVGLKAFPEFYLYHGLSEVASRGEDEGSGNRDPSLSILKIRGCPCLTTLHEGFLQHHLRHLQVLSIIDCEELIYWPEGEGFRATLHTVKEELSIERCPKLKALPEPDGSEFCASLKKLVVKACPGVPSKLLFIQLHYLNSGDVYVEQQYPNFACCSDEALRHMMVVDFLYIEFVDLRTTIDREGKVSPQLPIISLSYDKTEEWSFSRKENCLHGRLRLVIREAVVDVDGGAYSSEIVWSCLGGGHPWASSLRILTLRSIPDRAFLHHPLRLPLLEELRIWNYREMRLPTRTLLCHLTALQFLVFSNCPELTLSSVEEGIRSLPSLQKLYITRCPKLLMPRLGPSNNYGGGEEDGFSAAAPPPPPTPPSPVLPLLRDLTIDDARLLTRLLVDDSHRGQNGNEDNGHFFRNHLLTSLWDLDIFRSELTALTMDEEEGLRALASPLQCLRFKDCPNLQNLPADLKGLLPNLKVLLIQNCPEIRCLPELPSSLEMLFIEGCPNLPERCRPPPRAMPMRGAEDDDWHKITHIPVIQIDGVYPRGSFSRYLELKAKWDFIF